MKIIIIFSVIFLLLGIAYYVLRKPVSNLIPSNVSSLDPLSVDNHVDWERIYQKAQKEGRLVIRIDLPSQSIQHLSTIFNNRFYGIKLDIRDASSPDTIERIIFQRQLRGYFIDMGIGDESAITLLKPSKALAPIGDYLELSEVKDAANWWNSRLPYMDRENMLFAFSASVSPGFILYNTEFATHEDFDSYFDLLHPKWKGKIIMHDPGIEGKGATLFAWLQQLYGIEYWKNLYCKNRL